MAADETAAQTIAKGGALVAEVDSRRYLRRLDKLNEKCHALVYDAEWLSRQLQRKRRVSDYLTPIVAGAGEGGTLAEMIMVQAPSATIAGAISLDPSETIASRRPICSDLLTTARRGGFRYGVPKKLPGFWIVGLTHQVRRADRAYILRLRHEGAPIDLHELPHSVTAGGALLSLIEPYLAKERPTVANVPKATDISGLPLAELPVEHPSKLMAVLLSGDGGWRDLDKSIAEDLQRQGVPGRWFGQPAIFLEQEDAGADRKRSRGRDRDVHGQVARRKGRVDWLFVRGRCDPIRLQPITTELA